MQSLDLNPKVRAAAIVAILTAVITIGNQILNVYSSEWWAPILAVVLAVIAGYLTPAGDKPAPPVVAAPPKPEAVKAPKATP